METGASTGVAATHHVAHVAPVAQAAKSQLNVKEAANDPVKQAPAETARQTPPQGIPNKAQPALNSATAIALQTLASQEKINPDSQRQQYAFKRPERGDAPSELQARDDEARRSVAPGYARAAAGAFEKARQLKPAGRPGEETPSVAIFGPNGTHPGAERGGIVNISV